MIEIEYCNTNRIEFCDKCKGEMIRQEADVDRVGVAVPFVCGNCNNKRVYHLCDSIDHTCKYYRWQKWYFFGKPYCAKFKMETDKIFIMYGFQNCELVPGCKVIDKKDKL